MFDPGRLGSKAAKTLSQIRFTNKTCIDHQTVFVLLARMCCHAPPQHTSANFLAESFPFLVGKGPCLRAMLPEEFDLVVRRLIALGAPKDAQLSIPAIIGLNKIYCLWGYTLSWCFIHTIYKNHVWFWVTKKLWMAKKSMGLWITIGLWWLWGQQSLWEYYPFMDDYWGKTILLGIWIATGVFSSKRYIYI